MQMKIPYQPLPPLLLAAIAGILVDRFFALPALFWAFLCFAALAAWLACQWNTSNGNKLLKNLCAVLVAFVPLWLKKMNREEHKGNAKKNNGDLSYSLILIAFGAFFGLWHHDHWYRYAENDIGSYATSMNQPVALVGTVIQMPRYYPKPPPNPGQIFEPSERTVFTLRAEQLRDGREWIPVSGNVLVFVYDDCREFRIGDRLQLFGGLIQPPKPGNPGDHDYNAYLRGQRTLALLRCPDKGALTLLNSNHWSFNRWMESVRRTGLANLEKHLSDYSLPIAEAMIFGVRESVDDEIRQNMIDTGTMHLLAISGLHVVLVAGIAAWFLRQLRVSRRVTAIAMILFVLFYLMLTDVRTPAIRAVALTCCVCIAFYVNRFHLAKNVLCASALVVLFVRPSELFQFGAQLSFIAVASFFWMPSYFRLKSLIYRTNLTGNNLTENSLQDIEQVETTSWRWLRRSERILRRSVEVFIVSLIIWLFATPILLYHIHVFTPVAILVNPLLWVPLTIAMSCGFITAMIGQVPLIGNIFGIGADWSFWLMLEMITWFKNLGGHYWVPGPTWWWNLGFYAVFAFLTFLPVQRPRWWILLAALIVWILIGVGAGYYRDFERLRNDRLTLTVLSVGHGNSVLITTPDNRVIICDAGSLTSPRYVADSMSRAIWRTGKRHIDVILISHPDTDHFSGIPLLAERFSIGVVLISPYFSLPDFEGEEDAAWSQLQEQLEAKGIPIRIIGKGDDLSEYGLPNSIILHPPKEDFIERHISNATSLVLRLEHRGVGIMLPGDLDGWDTSPFLLLAPMPTEIVMVPHHGGRSRQTEPLLEWATPQILIFSHGSLTHRPERLEHFRQQGFEVRSTFVEGAIEIDIDTRYSLPSH